MIVKKTCIGTMAGLVLTMSVSISGALSAPTQIKPGFNLFSAEQDIEIGRKSALEVEQQLPILHDAQIEAYVNAIGARLAAVIPGAKFPYQFKVVNASDINAFALPGGFMYLNRGLIEAAKNEGQLAGVVAHEMSHVALRHGTNQASKAYLGQTGLGLLGGLLGKDKSSSDKLIGAVGGFGMNMVFLKFSRTDEEQADIVGAQTLAKAGYNPRDMVDFFDMLAAEQTRNPSKVEQYFSTHPAPQDRATRIRNEMTQLTIRPTQPVGGLVPAQATLAQMPAARSMQEIAKNAPATPQPGAAASNAPATTQPRAATPNAPVVASGIEAPSATFQAFQPRNGFFRIDHPTNWRTYESADGLGVTFAPAGGVVDAGGHERDLIEGVVINHYAPFFNDADGAAGPVAVQTKSRGKSGRSPSQAGLARATNDLVGQIVRTNPTLKLVPNSQRSEKSRGGSALSLVLAGRSPVTGVDERVTVFTRALPDDHVVYALCIAPGGEYGPLEATFRRMMGSMRVNQNAAH
jgi:Zn-dependent protease with chaperone function